MKCYHCHLPLPLDRTYPVTVQGHEERTCCPGCQAAVSFIDSLQLSNYYQFRTAPNLKVEASKEYASFDKLAEHEGVNTVSLLIEGVQCAACGWLIEKVLTLEPSVKKVSMALSSQKLTLEWDQRLMPLSQLVAKIAQLGYRPAVYEANKQLDVLTDSKRQALLRLGWSGLGMMQVMMFAIGGYLGEFQGITFQYAHFLALASLVVTLPILFFCGQPYFMGAIRALKVGHISMDLPISIALLSALGVSLMHLYQGSAVVYFDTICMFLFFLSASRFFEINARLKSLYPIVHLKNSLSTSAILADSGESCPIEEIRIGQKIIVPSGQFVPLDGKILQGTSAVSMGFLTGEMAPHLKQPGETVLAGAINHDQPLVIEVEAKAKDTSIQSILQLIERAETTKPKIVIWGNKIAQYFLISIIVLACGSGLYWQSLEIFITVLVVSCPCALSLALPLALTMAKNALLKKGVLVKNMNSLNQFLKIDTVVFDKTGTLTEGQFSVIQARYQRLSKSKIHAIVKSLEQFSEHPVGKALFEYCREAGTYEVSACQIVPHQGIVGQIDEVQYQILRDVSAEHRIILSDTHGELARFELADSLRKAVKPMVAALKVRGCDVQILSGDQSGPVSKVAAALNVKIGGADLTPADKLQKVKAYQAQGHIVCMVGDGLNDAPVLKQADVSVAVHSGTALSQLTADMILLNSDLNALQMIWKTASLTQRTLYLNLGWAMAYNLVMLPLAAIGWITPYWGGLGMCLSSIGVIWHSLHLARRVENLTWK